MCERGAGGAVGRPSGGIAPSGSPGRPGAGGAAAFGVDPAKVALLTRPGPLEGDFLSRMPVKGCRPRAAGDNNGVLPHAQGVTVGITCVIRF